MKIEAFKERVADSMHFPVELLTGETSEEVISQAKALTTYRQQHNPIYNSAGDMLALEMIEDEIKDENIITGLDEVAKSKQTEGKTNGQIFAEWAQNFF